MHVTDLERPQWVESGHSDERQSPVDTIEKQYRQLTVSIAQSGTVSHPNMAARSALAETVESLRKQAANYRSWAKRLDGQIAAEYLAQAESTDTTIADLERLIGKLPARN